MSGSLSPARRIIPWWEDVRQRANQSEAEPRLPLLIASEVAGSIALPLLAPMLEAHLPLRHAPGGAGVELAGEATSSLRSVADWLRAHELAGRWREELLAVRSHIDGPVLATVERGVARNLGIHTHAVQLHAREAGRGMWWLQQRALNKATDPGRWDTLAGGLVSDGESVAVALARESWEEAGVRLANLPQPPLSAGSYTVRRPVDDSGRHGYMVETVHAFSCVLGDGGVPVNHDGEVLRFDRFTDDQIDKMVLAGQLALEAAVAIALDRGDAVPSGPGA